MSGYEKCTVDFIIQFRFNITRQQCVMLMFQDKFTSGILLTIAIICIFIFGLPFSIASIITSEKSNPDCLEDNLLKLHDWLLGAGISHLFIIVLLITSCISRYYTIIFVNKFPQKCMYGVFYMSIVLTVIFGIIYTSIGVLVLIKNTTDCINTEIYVMSIVQIIVLYLSTVLSLSTIKIFVVRSSQWV